MLGTSHYLQKDTKGNQSPIVHMNLGGDLFSDRYIRLEVKDFERYLFYWIEGKPVDLLFRGFLLTPNRARSGRILNPLYEGFDEPTRKEDWQEWMDELFAAGKNLTALKEALSHAPPFLKSADVWVTLPYPERRQTQFGEIDGMTASFQREEDRFRALRWWMGEFLQRYRAMFAAFPSLRFRGFRWGREAILQRDLELVSQVAGQIHRENLQFLWLTNYGAANVVDWEKMGFDLTLLFPNYYGNTENRWEWIDHAAYFASTYHCGLQLTCGKGLLYNKTHIYDYLNRGLPEHRDYMNHSFLLMNFDGIDLEEIRVNDFPLYANLYLFFKGLYRKIAYVGMEYE